MQPSSVTYSIKDLEEKTGIKVRTIRFYIKEGLVPPPNGTGGGASYDDTHLVSLQAIRILHESQLKLGGIKEALGGLSLEQVRALVADAETGTRKWDSTSLQRWVNPVAGLSTMTAQRNFSFAAIGTRKAEQSAPESSSNILSKISRQAAPRQETWLRLSPLEGVEVQLREDVDPKIKALVMQLLEQLQNKR
jgi:DNA-binding transcriptional MerR regulator